MDLLLFRTVSLLALATVVAIVARRLHLPYTVGLVITGIGLAVVRVKTGIILTHDLMFDLILPPLLFEAALSIEWDKLRRDAFPVLSLATIGVIVSALVVAAGMVTVLGWPISSAIIFGILISATDPVAIIAMFKDAGITGRLRLLLESESLLNDGVAAVLFAVALAWAQVLGQGVTAPGHIALALLQTAGGGILAGVVFGGVAIAVVGRTTDHLVETALTTVAAYGSFLIAERVGASGVLATVASGLLMGNLGILSRLERNHLSPRGREFVVAFWEFAAFIANSFVFLLIGLAVASIPLTGLGITTFAIAIGLVLVARALTVYPLCLIFRRSRWAIPVREQHILWWGGLRGALALALALALPSYLQLRNEILTVAFGVVVFSVVVQGLTMPPVLRAGGFLPKRS
jgi:CPA1 family monovalent cation:H+ antiporter